MKNYYDSDHEGFAISNNVNHLEVLQCEKVSTAKVKDGLTHFLMLTVLDTKIFQYGLLEGHNA